MAFNPFMMFLQMGALAKLVLLGLVAMSVAIPLLAIGALREQATPRRQRGLLSIAASAPMLGFLGTVVGIINASCGLAALGVFEVKAVAAGLAEAFSMTALGLVIGVVALWVRTAVAARFACREAVRESGDLRSS